MKKILFNPQYTSGLKEAWLIFYFFPDISERKKTSLRRLEKDIS